MNNGNGAADKIAEKIKELDGLMGELAGLRRQISTCLAEVQESSRTAGNLEALRQSDRRMRQWLDGLPQRIYVKDKNLAYEWCNQSYARDLNKTPAEIIGKKDRDFHPPDVAAKYEAEDQGILAAGERRDLENRLMISGEEHIILAAKIPLQDAGGNITGLLGTFWDISGRKKAEEEPKKYIERLKKLVFERGAQIESLNDHLQKEIAERKRLEEELQKLRSSKDEGRPKNPGQMETAN